ncbi:hypothetical protein GUITHDRAFT_89623 [Guillardia theta CCMP2712]|uniref:PROP1-like PPR domain-containing protein n=1 Tax=Guillardia theta (strain CCMP2712) TaxID=905079 RepID=L1INC2_GUITC|nr:hypothetical protein GUITHDRAFT_89623 [Guillardia theta CCMP2712]EKX37597.1 hypothetical protein GUITHDRAFT_89623 [Guillardia theta CCMP2712]|eukprot:XP_005824577.1 hypothetical protein GUITHDRAFT_89623 [Guillardia theta CCMP2712]
MQSSMLLRRSSQALYWSWKTVHAAAPGVQGRRMQAVRTRSMASLPSAEEASSNEAKNRKWSKEVEERKLFATLRDLKGEEKKKFFRGMLANKTANIFHFNLMISSSRLIRESRELWETLNKMELTPDVVTYTSMIKSEVKAGNMSAAEKLFTAMRAKGVEPNEVTHGILIDGYHKHGRLEDVFSAWRRMKEQGLKTNEVIYSSLIDACAKRMDMARAEKLVEEVAANGFLFLDGRCYSVIIDAFARSGQVEEAEKYLEKMCEQRRWFMNQGEEGERKISISKKNVLDAFNATLNGCYL